MTEGAEYAKKLGCRFIETSAKTRTNVEECFHDLVREIRRFNKESSSPVGANKEYANGKRSSQLDMEGDEKTAGCCGKCIVM